MSRDSANLGQLAAGAAGGLAGTLVIHGLMGAEKRWWLSRIPPLRDEPGHFMVAKAESLVPRTWRRQIPSRVEQGVGQSLGIGYGIAFGALYAALRPRGGKPMADGLLLGLLCWAAGYLGWLPALGLMPPVWRQKLPQAMAPAIDHVAYGIATVVVYRWLRRLLA